MDAVLDRACLLWKKNVILYFKRLIKRYCGIYRFITYKVSSRGKTRNSNLTFLPCVLTLLRYLAPVTYLVPEG